MIRGDLMGIRFACLGGRLGTVRLSGVLNHANFDMAFRDVTIKHLVIGGRVGCDKINEAWASLEVQLGLTHLRGVQHVQWESASSLATACVVIGGLGPELPSLSIDLSEDPPAIDFFHLAQLNTHGLVHLRIDASTVLGGCCPDGMLPSLGLLALPCLKTFEFDALICCGQCSQNDEAAIARLLATHPSLETLSTINYGTAGLFNEAQRLVTSSSKLRNLMLYMSEPYFDDIRSMVHFLRDLPQFEHLALTVMNGMSQAPNDDVETALIDLFSTLGGSFNFLHFDNDITGVTDQSFARRLSDAFLTNGREVVVDVEWNSEWRIHGAPPFDFPLA